jgi:ABC-2 type transport system permease protein
MIFISAWVMLLALLRDRAALIMSFVLPPVLFIAFAAIFAGTSGSDLKLKIGLLDIANTIDTQRFAKALLEDKTFRFIKLDSGDVSDAADLVRRGIVDVSLLIRGDLEERPDQGPPPLLVIESSSRPLAGAIAMGEIQRTLNEKLPDVALARIIADVEASGAIGKEDREFLEKAFHEEAQQRKGDAFSFARVAEREIADRDGTGRHGNVLYYAGAVSAIFLLFGAVHGALTILDERENGIAQRLLISCRSLSHFVWGKFFFLTLQGTVQASFVYAAAYIIYGASFSAFNILLWLAACVFSSAASAGLALLVCCCCRTRKQAESLTTFAVLMVSAAGGSMVPRYLMPPWFQDMSWLTPNAWMIEALNRAVLPGASLRDVALPCVVLMLMAAATAGIAARLSAHRAM